MKNVCYIFLGVVVLLLACTSPKESRKEVQVFGIDIKKEAAPEAMERFFDNMEIRLMPLETTEECLFSGAASQLTVADGYLFVEDGGQQCFFRFDKTGKYINKIGERGEGDKEYTSSLSSSIANGNVYVKDWTRIQIYDYDNHYLRSIPYADRKCQIHVGPDGKIYARRSYVNDTQMQVLNPEGEVLAEHFPAREVLRGFKVPKGNLRAMGNYEEGVYVANPMDNTIYLVRDTVCAIARLDFGSMNIPSDFFDGSSAQVEEKFWNLRGGVTETQSVMFINNLIVTDEWITFCPETFDPVVVYCNRKNNVCITNRGFKKPYSVFFNGYNCPNGYDSATGEFYRLVNATELKEMIETLSEEDTEYLKKYPFLKGIDPEKINEDANDWVVFFKMTP